MDRTQQAMEAIARFIRGVTLVDAKPMAGGMSTHMIRLDVLDRDGIPQSVVARFPGEYIRTIIENPAAVELRTLQLIREEGIPAPMPIGLGDAPEGQFLLLELMPGKATAASDNRDSYIRQMAQALARIHSISLADGKFDFLLENKRIFEDDHHEMNVELRERELYDALLKFPAVPYGDVVLRHGDLWPGNMLWQGGKLTGIIDWEETLRGPAMGDVAICRLDVFWVFGKEAMEAFTAYYLEARPVSTSGLEFWDLRVALRPMQNFAEWVGPYASLDRPDMTTEGMRDVLLEFIEMGLRRVG